MPVVIKRKHSDIPSQKTSKRHRDAPENDPIQPNSNSMQLYPLERDSFDTNGVNSGDSTVGLYQTGAVIRMKLKNFVTYNEIEFFLGNSLNMITGPNGSGKSSFVCALCLGLFGKPELLGRSENLKDFVKFGSEEATIEIEIQCDRDAGEDQNLVITRRISKSTGSSEWALNGKQATPTAVKKQVKKYQFQIDNLCQFLPQDKVTSFARMSPQELLVSTEKATGNDDLVAMQEELKKKSIQFKEASASTASEREKLKRLQEEQAAADQVRKQVEQQELLRKEHELYSIMVPFAKVRHYETSLQKLENEIQEVKDQISNKESYVAPVYARVAAAENARIEIQDKFINIQADEKQEKNKLEKLIAYLTEKVSQATEHYDAADKIKEHKARYQNKVKAIKAKVAEVENMRDTHLSRKPNESELEEARDKSELLRVELHSLRDKKEDVEDLRTRKNRELSMYETRAREKARKLDQLKSVTAQRMQALGRTDERAYNAVNLYESQKGSIGFKHEVIKPALLSIKIKDSRCIKQVSAVLRKHHLTSFITQSYEDYLKLSKLLQDNRGGRDTRVDIRDYSRTEAPNFSPPLPREQLKQYGFDGYLIDLLEADSATLDMLCYEARIHSIPYATRPLTASQRQTVSKLTMGGKPLFNSYLDSINQTTVIISKYGSKDPTVKYDTLRDALPFIRELAGGPMADTESRQIRLEIGEIKEKIESLKEESRNLDADLQQIDHKIREMERPVARYKELREQMQGWTHGLKKREAQVAVYQDELDTAISSAPDFEAEKQKSIEQYGKVIEKIQDASRASSGHSEKIVKLHRELLTLNIAQLRMLSEERGLKHLLKTEMENLQKKLENLESELNRKREKSSAYRSKLIEKYSNERLTEAENKIMDDFEMNEDTDWEEILVQVTRKKNQLHAEMELANDIQLAATASVANYEKRAEMIEALTEKLNHVNTNSGTLLAEINEIRSAWEPRLQRLLDSVSEVFSQAFETIKCRGRVELYKGEGDQMDFSQWAVHIKVSFRENGDLQLLTSQRQSGGERAVSTVMYLMALQHQTSAPFRVVDEINQGMDGANERMVHNRMVDVACDENTSQYFLVTPKLLSDLDYHEKMRVMCIFSSDTVEFSGGSQTTTRHFVSKMKQLKRPR